MPQQFHESVELLTAGQITINLNPATGDILIGGNGLNGDVMLFQPDVIDPNESSPATIHINAEGSIRLGGNGVGGDVRLFRAETFPNLVEDASIHLDGEGGILRIGNDGVDGSITLLNGTGKVLLQFNAGDATIIAGGDTKSGKLILKNNTGLNRIRLDAEGANGWFGGNGEEGNLFLFPSSANNKTINQASVCINGGSANLQLGGNGTNGDIDIKNELGLSRIRFDAGSANGRFGGEGEEGNIFLYPATAPFPFPSVRGAHSAGKRDTTTESVISPSAELADIISPGIEHIEEGIEGEMVPHDFNYSTIHLDGGKGNIRLGGGGQDGDLILRNKTGKSRVLLDAEGANGWFGGNGEEGNIFLFSESAETQEAGTSTIHLDGGLGNLRLGGGGQDGDLILRNATGQDRILLDANGAKGWFGGNGEAGDLILKNGEGKTRVRLTGEGANGWFGGNGEEGNIFLFPASGDNETADEASIHLNGNSGDIILRNADFAEDFDIVPEQIERLEKGTVMVLNDAGVLQESAEPFDKRVVGVISGAGGFKPGIIMDKKVEEPNRLPIGLMGKVFCKVDADYAAIEPGDMLCSSATPGHAMKAGNSQKAVGAILGKALKPLNSGKGLIPVLITLQ